MHTLQNTLDTGFHRCDERKPERKPERKLYPFWIQWHYLKKNLIKNNGMILG